MRIDLQIIAEWIQPQSRACWISAAEMAPTQPLAKYEIDTGYGLEIDPFNITACIQKGQCHRAGSG